MKRLLIVLLFLASTGIATTGHVQASGCGYQPYYSSYHAGYDYWSGGYWHGRYYRPGYYPSSSYSYSYPSYYTPTYTVSYNPDSAKQLEIIDRAVNILGKLATTPAGQRPNMVEVPQQQVPRDGLAVLNVRCAACHEAGKVAEKGSKLALLNGGRLADGLTLDQKREAVVRIHAGDKKMMPPSRPLAREERAMLADILGIQVVETPAP